MTKRRLVYYNIMADISKCPGDVAERCELAMHCYRHQAEDSGESQSYLNLGKKSPVGVRCMHFWRVATTWYDERLRGSNARTK